jgi:iron(III) transport system ATP-binding protein
VLSIENLAKSYGSDRKAGRARRSQGTERPRPRVFAVSDVTFEVQAGELFTLLGPSGCGKTTTLRSVAGLEQPDSGSISLEDTVLFDGARGINVPTNRRGLGMVFQSYAIWPHMSVFENVTFPLRAMPRRSRPAKAEISERVQRVLEVTDLAAYSDRPATMLSGGQQQRLALARAMVTAPPLMLLDEPLSNLDAKLRESMRFEIKRLQRELGLTSIYVTHDQTEALMLPAGSP